MEITYCKDGSAHHFIPTIRQGFYRCKNCGKVMLMRKTKGKYAIPQKIKDKENK